MVISPLFLPKKTGTYADALAAIGLGRLVSMLADVHPRITDKGWAYAVTWEQNAETIANGWEYERLRKDPGYRYVLKADSDPKSPGAGASIVYNDERKRLLSYRQQRQEIMKARGGKLTQEDRDQLAHLSPMSGWYLYQNMNVLQAFGSYNQLHSAIRECNPTCFRDSIVAKLNVLAAGGDTSAVDTDFSPKLSSVQAFSPSVGKGINRPKPDSTLASGLPGYFVDWFEEWLKYIGIGLAGNSYKVGDHIKMLAIAPGDLEDAAIGQLWNQLVSLRLPGTSIKIDVLAALGMANVLVNRSGLLGEDSDDPFSLFGRTPRDIVAGLQTAFFSNLGNAYALTNTSFIGIPGWFPVKDRQSAGAWVSIIAEHERVIRWLDEEKSEETALLLRYRDFLSAGAEDLRSLLEFFALFACHAMRKGGKGYVPQFTTQNIGRLLMGTAKGYQGIVNNSGFRAVAAAMRRATVSEQFHKARTGRQDFEIRYSLFQDLRQKARFKDQVIALIAGFVADYNYENARKAEQGSKQGRSPEARRRPQVTQQQLDDLMEIMDSPNHETVVMLLIAYASSRDARESTSIENQEPTDVGQFVVQEEMAETEIEGMAAD